MERLLLSVTLRSDRTAPARAREALRDVPELANIRDDAALVVSELVTNAVKHSGATDADLIMMNIFVDAERAKIQVHDPARTERMPRLREHRSQHVDEWGLRLVDRLARKWDTELGDGRIVWADLPFSDRRLATDAR
jgi:serine/threonine-protein kinase RsbW